MSQQSVEVEDGVPIPTVRSARMKYPFYTMAPGQSFFTPVSAQSVEKWGTARAVSSLQASLLSCAKKCTEATGRKFISRRALGPAGEPGVRVWYVNESPEESSHG